MAIPVMTVTESGQQSKKCPVVMFSAKMYHVNTFSRKIAELFKGMPSGTKQKTLCS